MSTILEEYKLKEQEIINLKDRLVDLGKTQADIYPETVLSLLADLRKYYESDLSIKTELLQILENTINGVILSGMQAKNEQLQYLDSAKNNISNPKIGVFGGDDGAAINPDIQAIISNKEQEMSKAVREAERIANGNKPLHESTFVKLVEPLTQLKPRLPINNSMVDTSPINLNTNNNDFPMGLTQSIFM